MKITIDINSLSEIHKTTSASIVEQRIYAQIKKNGHVRVKRLLNKIDIMRMEVTMIEGMISAAFEMENILGE